MHFLRSVRVVNLLLLFAAFPVASCCEWLALLPIIFGLSGLGRRLSSFLSGTLPFSGARPACFHLLGDALLPCFCSRGAHRICCAHHWLAPTLFHPRINTWWYSSVFDCHPCGRTNTASCCIFAVSVLVGSDDPRMSEALFGSFRDRLQDCSRTIP